MDVEEIKETFAFLDDWEERYRFIIDLGKSLPEIAPELKTDANLVRGCQSQVWLVVEPLPDGRLALTMDSDAHIVRGLIAIVLAALDQRTPQDILAADMEGLFAELDLLTHLSQTRGNGLVAMLNRIRTLASSQME